MRRGEDIFTDKAICARGQASLEYMILMGFITMIIVGILGVAVFYTGGVQHGVRNNQINEFAQKVVATSEYIFYAGEPSKATITAYVPEGVTAVNITENSIVVTYQDSGGESVRLFPSNVNITGNLSNEWGVKNIEIAAVGGEVVIRPA